MARPEQLALALPGLDALTRDDFLEAPSNSLALAALEDGAGLPAGLAVLTGPAGSGKTHLARIWATRRGAVWLEGPGLEAALPALLAPDAPRAFALDDAHRLAGGPGEEALFHVLNHLRGRGEVLLSAPGPVRDWGLTLPDLASRLNAATPLALLPPDEALLAAVLVKQFDDRQIRVEPALIGYLVGRMERSLAAARDLVARLDAASLERQRPITRDLARALFFTDPPATRD